MSPPTVGHIFCSPDRRQIRISFCGQIEACYLSCSCSSSCASFSRLTSSGASLGSQTYGSLSGASLVSGTSGSWLSSSENVRFSPVLATKLCRNPHRTVQGSPPLSVVLRPHLLGGVSCDLHHPPVRRLQTQRDLSSNWLGPTALFGLRLNLFPFPVETFICILTFKYIFLFS